MPLKDREKMAVLQARSKGPEIFTPETGLSAVARVAQMRGVRFLRKGNEVDTLGDAGVVERARKDVIEFLATNPVVPSIRTRVPRQLPDIADIKKKVKAWADAAGPGTGLTENEKDLVRQGTFFGPELGRRNPITGEHL
jgi:hypothetical protein